MKRTRQEAREAYENLEDWTDEDFETAESNWSDQHFYDDENDSNVEPYGSEFLDWCSEYGKKD